MNPQSNPPPRRKASRAWSVAGYSLAFVVAAAFVPVCDLLTVGPNGNSVFQDIKFLAATLVMSACCAIGVGLVMLVFPAHRKAAMQTLGFGALALLAVVLGIRTGIDIRMAAFHKLTIRSKPIIAAIVRFEQDHKRPPKSFEDLIPTYLPAIPKTGMGAYPDYEFVSGDKAKDYDENPWALYVPCSSGLMNWDIFLYLPKQNYPERGYGGTLQRVGDWAYVHE